VVYSVAVPVLSSEVVEIDPPVSDSPLDEEDEPEEPDGLVFEGLSEEIEGDETSPPLTDPDDFMLSSDETAENVPIPEIRIIAPRRIRPKAIYIPYNLKTLSMDAIYPYGIKGFKK
jgi:hypothetical protein